MRSIKVDEEKERLAFALKAAEFFSRDPYFTTFTDGEIVQGCYLAIRWGLHGRAIVVVKLDEYEEPVNYHDLVPLKVQEEPDEYIWDEHPVTTGAAGDHQESH